MSFQKKIAIYCTLLFLSASLSNHIYVINAAETLQQGSWVKYEVKIAPLVTGEIIPIWTRFEYTNIEGTNATVQMTIYLSDGDEWKVTTSIDILSGSDTGLIISPNSKILDPVRISGFGNLTIKSETVLTYTGVSRTAVYADYANSTDILTFFWDKQTGILLEQNITRSDSSTVWKIADTNIWQTQISTFSPFQIVAFVVVGGSGLASIVLFMMRKRKLQTSIKRRK